MNESPFQNSIDPMGDTALRNKLFEVCRNHGSPAGFVVHTSFYERSHSGEGAGLNATLVRDISQ